MTVAATSFIDELKAAAARAEAVEAKYRQEAVQRIAQLEKERAFAYRRLNLLSAVAGTVTQAESEDDAVAHGLALLRDRLAWSTVDEARDEVLSRFAPVVVAVLREIAPPQGASPGSVAVADALAEFEAWYLDQRRNPFWVLFEQELPELPLVEV